jgi:hypothetical protein
MIQEAHRQKMENDEENNPEKNEIKQPIIFKS